MPLRRGFSVYGNVEWTDAGLGPRRTLADVPKRREDVEKLFSRVRNATLIRLPAGGAPKIRFGQRIDSIVALLRPARDFFNSFKWFPYTAKSGPIARPYTNRGHRVPGCRHAGQPTTPIHRQPRERPATTPDSLTKGGPLRSGWSGLQQTLHYNISAIFVAEPTTPR